jgi:hypothetical protein
MSQHRRTAGAIGVAAAFVASAFVALAYGGGVTGAPSNGPASADQYGERVTICHRTGSRRNPFRTITVAQSAVPAHLRHGDTTGPCSRRLNGTVTTRVVLTTTTGRTVRRVGRGFFWVVVSDRSRFANFHLTGPRVNRRTSARFRGTVRWRVRLVRGTYRYRADFGARGGGTFRVR